MSVRPGTAAGGNHAAGLYAHAEAVQQYEAALELLADAGDARGVARVREKLGVELRRLGRYERHSPSWTRQQRPGVPPATWSAWGR